MIETNRIEYKRELTSELDIEKEVWRYKYLCAYVDDSFKFINSFIVVPQVLMNSHDSAHDGTKSAPS